MKIDSHLKGCTVVAFLSFPFWFLMCRYGRELGTGPLPPSTTHAEARVALAFAAVMALITLGVAFLWSSDRSKKP